MSKLLCLCGNTVSDFTQPCPTEGDFIGAADSDRLHREAVDALDAFVDALLSGRRDEWISAFFHGPCSGLSDRDIISNILASFDGRRRSIAECERCGRLWVQVRSDENFYLSYVPDEGGYAELLRGRPKHER